MTSVPVGVRRLPGIKRPPAADSETNEQQTADERQRMRIAASIFHPAKQKVVNNSRQTRTHKCARAHRAQRLSNMRFSTHMPGYNDSNATPTIYRSNAFTNEHRRRATGRYIRRALGPAAGKQHNGAGEFAGLLTTASTTVAPRDYEQSFISCLEALAGPSDDKRISRYDCLLIDRLTVDAAAVND
jgi:hypothetical protein